MRRDSITLTFAQYFYVVILAKAAVWVLFGAFKFGFLAADHLKDIAVDV